MLIHAENPLCEALGKTSAEIRSKRKAGHNLGESSTGMTRWAFDAGLVKHRFFDRIFTSRTISANS
jgi:hypothetical protein